MKAHRALLIEHTKTSKHIKAAEPFSNHRQLKLQLDQVSAYSLETIIAEIKMILFVTCHCAIRSVDRLSALIKPIFNLSLNLQTNSTKLNCIEQKLQQF